MKYYLEQTSKGKTTKRHIATIDPATKVCQWLVRPSILQGQNEVKDETDRAMPKAEFMDIVKQCEVKHK